MVKLTQGYNYYIGDQGILFCAVEGAFPSFHGSSYAMHELFKDFAAPPLPKSMKHTKHFATHPPLLCAPGLHLSPELV